MEGKQGLERLQSGKVDRSDNTKKVWGSGIKKFAES